LNGSMSVNAPRSRGGVAQPAGGGAGAVHKAGLRAACAPRQGTAPVPTLPLTPRGTTMTDRWSLQDSLELGPLTEVVPCARLHARQILWEWGPARLGETAELIVAELMNNAVAASRFLPRVSPVQLWLLSDRKRALMIVWHACPQPPQPTGMTYLLRAGGLLLVENFSDPWDWYATKDTGGKWYGHSSPCNDERPEVSPTREHVTSPWATRPSPARGNCA
jgi:hypothetical protein